MIQIPCPHPSCDKQDMSDCCAHCHSSPERFEHRFDDWDEGDELIVCRYCGQCSHAEPHEPGQHPRDCACDMEPDGIGPHDEGCEIGGSCPYCDREEP